LSARETSLQNLEIFWGGVWGGTFGKKGPRQILFPKLSGFESISSA